MTEVWKPERAVQIVAGTPPGGGLDRVARALAKAIAEAHLVEVLSGGRQCSWRRRTTGLDQLRR